MAKSSVSAGGGITRSASQRGQASSRVQTTGAKRAAHGGRGKASVVRENVRSSTDVDASVGKRVRAQRTLLKLSQEQLAEKLGVSFQQVQKYESGTNRIGASRLYKLATVLETDVNSFFAGLPMPHISARRGTELRDSPPMPLTGGVGGQREALELMRCYYDTPRELRKNLLNMVRSFAEQAKSLAKEARGVGGAERRVQTDAKARTSVRAPTNKARASVRAPANKVRAPVSKVRAPASKVRASASKVRTPASKTRARAPVPKTRVSKSVAKVRAGGRAVAKASGRVRAGAKKRTAKSKGK